MDVESVVRVLREVGRDNEASRLLRLFMEKRQEERSFYDLSDPVISDGIKDTELRELFGAKF